MFDNAFKSRIHLPLYFPPLEKKETPATWRHNLRRTLQRREPFLEADEKEILAFAKSQYNHGKMTEANWDGRQIRNAIQIAAALAEFEAQKRSEEIHGGKIGVDAPVYATLNKSHFITVTRASQQFDEYINSFRMTLSERAAQKANRNDEFKYVGDIFDDESQEEVFKPPTPMRSQKARRDVQETFDDEGIPRQAVAGTRVPRQAPRPRDPYQDTYENKETPRTQTPPMQRRKVQRAQPQRRQIATDSRGKQSSPYGYPTPEKTEFNATRPDEIERYFPSAEVNANDRQEAWAYQAYSTPPNEK